MGFGLHQPGFLAFVGLLLLSGIILAFTAWKSYQDRKSKKLDEEVCQLHRLAEEERIKGNKAACSCRQPFKTGKSVANSKRQKKAS